MFIDKKSKLDNEATFKISRFKEVIKRTKPHKHSGYYELIFIVEGEGFHTVDTTSYKVSAPEFYMLSAGQLHCWQFTAIPRGFVILIKEEEFDNLIEPTTIKLLKELKSITRIPIVGSDVLFAMLEDLFLISKDISSAELQHSYLAAIFAKLLLISRSTIEESKGVQSKIYTDFLSMLSADICTKHRVNEYAAKLHTTPQNINALCRKYSGTNASNLITQQLMLEIKRYLLHTDNTIIEIAEIVGFEDVSNFVKYFKKQEGITPKQFRLQYFQ